MRGAHLLPSLLLLLVPAAGAFASCSDGADTSTGGAGGTATTSASSSSGGVSSSGAGGTAPLPETFTVTGVVTDGASPVEGAIVMQGGAAPAFTTGPDGTFTLTMSNGPGIPTVVAAKVGYRTPGFEVYELPQGPIELVLAYAAPPDNIAYAYMDPGTGDPAHDKNTSICGHCHGTYVRDFQDSGHNEASRNEMVQDLYAGVSEAHADAASCAQAGGVWRTGRVPGTIADSASKCYLGGGVLPDLNPACGGPTDPSCDDPALAPAQKPKAFGRCADCHGPGIDGPAGGRDLLDAVGLAYEHGNHCDVCHHVKDVDLSKPPGVGGALIVQRPIEKSASMSPLGDFLPIYYGPEPDVPNGFMGGSYQPKFKESVFCGGCHEQKQEALVPGTTLDPVRWPEGLPTHSTYSEWAASSFGGTTKTCQYCHMPPDDHGLNNSVDGAVPALAGMTFGFPRKPEQLRKHTFRSPVDGAPRLFEGAVTVDLGAASVGGALAVTAQVKSVNTGHAIPTGEPMRALLLVLHADACGAEMTPAGGMTLDDWGGAAASGVVGLGVSVAGAQVVWPGATGAMGARVRVVRPTGQFDDYVGVGFFADPTLTAPEKGLEVFAPVGEATVTAVNGATLTLDHALAAQAGDVVYLGDAPVWPPVDDTPSLAVAGRAGYSFARTLVDPGGARGVPHFRAVDMVSDNRLSPGVTATTTHTFAIPPGCASATVSAAVLYRPVPVIMARTRGWEAHDFVVATASTTAPLP